MKQISISTPGRICLFGEHQDYLGLPIIAAGISRRVKITGKSRHDKFVNVYMPDINDSESFIIDFPLKYVNKRDYYRSALNVLNRIGYEFEFGFDITIKGDIPINSGTSSSSALIVTWIHFLSQMASFKPKDKLTQEEIAALAFKAEVTEFDEPGGMMDQYATALGNVIYLETHPQSIVKNFDCKMGTFVLGDSQEPKDTLRILKHVKFGMLEILKKIKSYNPIFDLKSTSMADLDKYKNRFSTSEFKLLQSNVWDRDLLLEAKKMFETGLIDDFQLGKLLNNHQDNLRDSKKISTPKINRMIDESIKAGAFGAKINGSGGGGCMFAYAPDKPEEIAEAIKKAGGIPYIINVGEGTRIDIVN
jgi:galactokinase